MVDAKNLARANLRTRHVTREPNGEEIAMLQVALTHSPAPRTLSELLDIMGDSNQFDFSVDFGLIGQLIKVVETSGPEPLEDFTRRWAS
jgi:hypothetical protein